MCHPLSSQMLKAVGLHASPMGEITLPLILERRGAIANTPMKEEGNWMITLVERLHANPPQVWLQRNKLQQHQQEQQVDRSQEPMFSSFSGLPMGTMGQMDILPADMWRRHQDLNKEDKETSTKWRKRLCGTNNQNTAMQHKFLPRYDLTDMRLTWGLIRN